MRIAKIVLFEILLILGSVLIYRSALVIIDRFVTAGDMEISVTLLSGLCITVICLYMLDKVALEKRGK